jgi:hypothetical protein
MATPFTAFYPYVLPMLPGCPTPVLDQGIRASAIEFCRNTNIIQTMLTPVDVVAGTTDYTVTMPVAGTNLAQVLKVWYDGNVLTPANTDMIDNVAAWRGNFADVTVDSDAPQWYFQKVPTVPIITLYPVPAVNLTGGLTIRAASKPNHTATTLDDILFEDWVEAIAAGAIVRIGAMPDKAYTLNADALQYWERVYDGYTHTAFQQNTTGNLRGDMRVRFRRFGT